MERGRRRRLQAAGARAAERPRRRQLRLRQAAGELPQRHHPPNPRQLARQGDGQHRRQPVADAPRLAELGHLAQEPVEAPQALRLRRRRRPAAPGRRLLQPAQRLRRAPPQRPHPDRLRPAVLPPAPRSPGEAPGLPNRRPARRAVAGPREPGGVHEGLRQQHRMPPERLHVRRQAAQRQPQDPRRQVRGPAPRQNQEPRVAGDQVQAPELLLRRPAQPAVPPPDLERPRRPPQQRRPLPVRRLRHVPERRPEGTPEPQVMVRLHEAVPCRPLRRLHDRAHPKLAQRNPRRPPRHRASPRKTNSDAIPARPAENVQRTTCRRQINGLRTTMKSPWVIPHSHWTPWQCCPTLVARHASR